MTTKNDLEFIWVIVYFSYTASPVLRLIHKGKKYLKKKKINK